MVIYIGDDIVIINGLMSKTLIQSAENFPPFSVVVDYRSYHIQQDTALVIHVGGTFVIDTILSQYWSLILDGPAVAMDVFLASAFANMIFDIQCLRIVCETFVNPQIGEVFCGNVVAEPFVATFMNDNKVPSVPPSRPRKVPAQVTILIFVAVCHCALVLHTQKRGFNQLKSVGIKRVGAKPVLECLEHGFHVGLKVCTGFCFIVAKYPEV